MSRFPSVWPVSRFKLDVDLILFYFLKKLILRCIQACKLYLALYMRLLLNSIYLSLFFGLNGYIMGVSGSIELYNIVLLLHHIEHKIECLLMILL